MYPHLLISILALFTSLVLGIKIGITPDYYDYAKDSDGSVSFSAQITFEDKSIPGDSKKMSDGQLINLAKVAYDEMIGLLDKYLVPEDVYPATLMAMTSEGSIYFTSSIKCSTRDSILSEYAKVPGSPAEYISHLDNGFGCHRYGGCCAEPNGLYFYSEQNRKGDEPFKAPPKTEHEPRVAVWLRPYNKKPHTNSEKAEDPCDSTMSGYGCQELVTQYGLKPVDKKKGADPTGQDNWKFTTIPNRRDPTVCKQPPNKPPGS